MRHSPLYARAFAFLPLFWISSCASPELCEDQITWAPGSPRISIDRNDRLLICGDPEYPAWRKIPPGQSASFLRSYLESKAYLNPRIDIDYEKSRIVVDAGGRSEVTEIVPEDAPADWKNGPLEVFVGEPLEKETLDRITNHALERLRARGYACAKVTLSARPEGQVTIRMDAGEKQVYPQTADLIPPPVAHDILGRYEPYPLGAPFDIRKTLLAGRRMEAESVASSVQYLPVCEDGKLVRLDRSASFGPRRNWEIGVGASTEEYPLAFVRWKNNRLWGSASNLQSEIFGSNLRQKFSTELKWYHQQSDRRMYLQPGFQVEHRNEDQYETIETKFSTFLGRTFDSGDWAIDPKAGASIRRLNVYDTRSDRVSLYFTPGAVIAARTHEYELFRGSPRTGSEFNLVYDFLPGSQAKAVSVHRLLAQGTVLWNFRDYVEPRWVLGGRFTFGNLATGDGSMPDIDRIPPDWFFLVGGDRDLRGFGRNTLPSEEQGAGSVLTAGIESRWPNLFSFPLEPLVFWDLGWMGNGNFRYESPLHHSPGIGARSATPVGTVRVTYARGWIPAQGLERNQFFLSFGTEF